MELKIVEETADTLAEYEKISIAFEVKSIFRLELIENGLGGVKFVEEAVATPFIKDYDAHEKPSHWTQRFDLSNWGILAAFDSEKRIGGATVVWNSPEVRMLEGRDDLACLWDLRVAPAYRGKLIGQHLFDSVSLWARERNCRQIKVETQNINVPACRFYARQGCHLGAFNRHGYPAEMNEVQLIWFRDL